MQDDVSDDGALADRLRDEIAIVEQRLLCLRAALEAALDTREPSPTLRKYRQHQCARGTTTGDVVIAILDVHRDGLRARDIYTRAKQRLPTLSYDYCYTALWRLRLRGWVESVGTKGTQVYRLPCR
jgi:hypothetical protein